MDSTWTIGELAERAAAALAVDGSAQVSGRVRDLPNERLIRWYTTIGLVDPPLARRGRTALYGPRHLLQLVAVKRRQAAGRSIAEIQLELTAATDTVLGQIASLPTSTDPPNAGPAEARQGATAADARGEAETTAPAGVPSTEAAASAPGEEAEGRERGSFWSARPDVSYRRTAVADGYGASPPAVVQGVRLAPGLTMLLDVPALSGDDLAAIETAAGPLLDELRRRGLLPPAGNHVRHPAFPPADEPRRTQ
ncbi:MerR family transcriptional regulator [Actinomadura darangshiensis]|uniref:MerR family transcriptional regulator n=1 Tax=Actinomadura darangshiensis TaxID=705336 RepID=A0A4R5B5S0_9ACTN|nr:MerR family transcriptional regulator [Actinomadura darangshiensis]TDD78984.1 MerR family transcriptional regulator [Actinomadura darangshiensis]